MSGTGRFVRHLSVNALLYVAVAVAVGTPAIAVFVDLEQGDRSAIEGGLWSVLLALSWFSWVIVVHLGVYLTFVYRWPSRLVAALLSPLAIGVLFMLTDRPAELAVALAGGVVYALSLDLPGHDLPWWRNRRLAAAAAAGWLVSLGAVEAIQRSSAGVETDVVVTVEGRRYRLACEHDRGGRVLRAVRTEGRAHPGGKSACVVLEDAASSLDEGLDYLQDGCPPEAPAGRVEGRVAGRPFRQRIVAARCDDDVFAGSEAGVVVPVG